MSAKNEARIKTAYVLLVIGLILFGVGFTDSGWAFFASLIGFVLVLFGGVMFTSVSIINGFPWFARLMSRLAEPVWNGEILYVDGSGYQIRYELDDNDRPWFVAADICSAIDVKAPPKTVFKRGGAALYQKGDHLCFSEETVQAYLIPVAIHNRAANRLLLNIRNSVLRKLEKQRELPC